ncbi:MAG TPA: DUF4124 domain-containing protein [Luteimonas sp.]
MSRLSRIMVLLLPACLAAPLTGASAQEAQGDVTIYRCTGADGQVVIGNVPCAEGADQQVRSMVRPVDGAPAPRVSTAAPAPAIPAQTVQYVQVQPAQALYECVRSDGSTYESDTGVGEERWIPVWAGGGWPTGGYRGGKGAGTPGGRGDIGARGPTTRAGSGLSAPPVSRISIPANPPGPEAGAAAGPRPRPPHGGPQGAVAGGYVERDPCHPLPQAEACARLRDRRDTIRGRFFNAQQVERDTLRVEDRGLNARIDRDCRTY